MEFYIKKTHELSDKEIDRILEIHKSVFGDTRSKEIFYNQFINTQVGYSYHLLMTCDEEIVGSHTYIPAYFIVNGKPHLFVTGADTMILKGHRDLSYYIDMLNYGRSFLKKEGVSIDYGYPNDLNYQILTKAKLSKSVGEMYTYFLPYRVGGIKKKLRFFNFGSKLFCLVWLQICNLLASSKPHYFIFSKEIDSYNKVRYKRNDAKYSFGDGFAYKIINYEGIRTAFLIDVYEKSPKQFCKAVKYIIKHEADNFDILLYPGFLPFRFYGLIKIPHRFEPKHFHVTAKIINKENIDVDALYNLSNWDTNLSNYDLI